MTRNPGTPHDGRAIKSSAYRLRGEAAFGTLFANAKRYSGPHVQLLAMNAVQTPGRLGFVIGRHVVRRAVDRNRLRRRWREAVRIARPRSAGFDIVFRVRSRIARDQIDAVAIEGRGLLAQLLTA